MPSANQRDKMSEYIAELCRQVDGKFVPFASERFTAEDQSEAIRKATEWRTVTLITVEAPVFFQVTHNGSTVHFKSIGALMPRGPVSRRVPTDPKGRQFP